MNPRLDADLETICLKCLEKDPKLRYVNADALAQDLDSWLAGKPILARPANSCERSIKWARRNPVVASLTASAALILVAGITGVLWQWQKARTQAIRADKNAILADAHERESRQRLVRSYVAIGNRLVEEGEPFIAMLWLSEALRLDSGNSSREANHRLRLASLLGQSPRLLQLCVHGSPLSSADFSRDGKRVLTAGRDGQVLVWNVDTGEKILGPLKHQSVISQASFIANDEMILTATFNGDGARMWDARTGELRRFFEHKGLRRTTLSHNGKWLLTWGGLDGQIKLWDAATAELAAPRVRHGYVTRMAVFSPDDERFATASTDRTVLLWDRATIQPLFPPFQQGGEVRSLAFNQTGTRLFAGNWEQEIKVWDTATGTQGLPSLPHKGLSTEAALLLSPDGRWLASLSLEGTVKIWDADSGRLVMPVLHHSSAAVQMEFDSTSRRLAVGYVDGTARVWDLSRDEPSSVQLNQSRKTYGLRFSPDDRRLLTASSDGSVRVWDLTGEGLSFAPGVAQGETMLELGNGNNLLTQNAEGALRLWDAKDWKPVGAPIPNDKVTAKAWLSRDAQRLLGLSVDVAPLTEPTFVSAPAKPRAARLEFKLWEAKSGKSLGSFEADVEAKYSLWVSPNCDVIAISQSNRIAFHHPAKPIQRCDVQLKTDAIRHVAFNEQGSSAAVLTRTEAHILDPVSGSPVFASLKLSAIGMCAAFSTDGKLAIASGDEFTVDREARLLDAKSGKALAPTLEHNGVISAIEFSPDGRRLVTASHDRAARIWDAATGRLLAPPLEHNAGVSQATFSSDSQWVATFCEDGISRVWNAETGEPLTPPLRSPIGASSGCFLADAKYLLTQCGSAHVGIWELRRDARPVEDWVAITSFLAARRFNESGFVESQGPDSIGELWKLLQTKYPNDFQASAGFQMSKAPPGFNAPPSTIRPVPLQ